MTEHTDEWQARLTVGTEMANKLAQEEFNRRMSLVYGLGPLPAYLFRVGDGE